MWMVGCGSTHLALQNFVSWEPTVGRCEEMLTGLSGGRHFGMGVPSLGQGYRINISLCADARMSGATCRYKLSTRNSR